MIKTEGEPGLQQALVPTNHLMKQGDTFTDALAKQIISIRQMLELLRDNTDTTTNQIANWCFTKLTDLLCMTIRMRSSIGDPEKIWYDAQEKKDFHIKSELANIARQFSLEAKLKKCSFHYSCSEDLPYMVFGDPILLAHILFVWLDNISSFSKRGNSIEMYSFMDFEGYITIKIIDTAGRLKKQDIEQLFCERRESSQQRVMHSNGLFLCQKMAESMGGKIEITPTLNGLAFFLYFLYKKL
jgi:K+-sensing histidine kinase KdpD